jgi:hypothetical protein
MKNEELLKKLNELFGSYRAEWLKSKIFDFFAEPSYFVALKDTRPCVLQGGRGTGKTTVLRGLSYQGQYALRNNSIEQFDGNDFIGIYYRVNTNHVRAFIGGGVSEENWQKIFGHYFNLVICREILLFVNWHKEKAKTDDVFTSRICSLIAKALHIEDDCNNFSSLLDLVEAAMYEFQSQINNISDGNAPKLSMPGDPIKLVTECVISLPQFKDKMFYFLIDEYENLEDYQQQCLNSLLKHNTDLYTFKIGVRELGWRVKHTLNHEELLNDPADYVLIIIEEKFTEENYFNDFARNVCQQRIKQLFPPDESATYSIEEALPALSMEEEAIKLGIEKSSLMEKVSNLSPEHKNKIQDLSLLYQFFISYWAENHNEMLEDTISNYLRNIPQWDTRYENYKHSMLFKIRKGRGMVGIQKYYAGWNTYIKLSNGNIRYLMELVYRAYEKHLLDDNDIASSVSYDNQTIAAQEIGMKNLRELEGLWKNGAQLTKLLLGFGRIFNVLISENGKNAPEINQITIKGNINSECNEILTAAVMNLAFIRILGNKLSNQSATREYMYAIHPIYAPYFVFSYRRKRKMEITEQDFMGVISEPKKYIEAILKRKKININIAKELPIQLTLFKDFYNND